MINVLGLSIWSIFELFKTLFSLLSLESEDESSSICMTFGESLTSFQPAILLFGTSFDA
uniref:Uncharacterized protein n=1 Tax=Vitis vinifera TaxID=29760 RepID=F6HA37_VITVI